MPTVPASVKVLHSLPGRLRLALSAWSGHDPATLESRIKALPGVHSARANPTTGNLLVRFVAELTTEPQLVHGVSQLLEALPAPLKGPLDETAPLQTPLQPHAIRDKRHGDGGRRGRARISVRGLDRNPRLAQRVVEHLQRMPGVHASANPLTGRVLVEWNEYHQELEDLVAQVAEIELPPLCDEDRPAYPLDPAPLVQSTTRSVGAALGLGVLAVRQATGANGATPGSEAAANFSAVVGLVQAFPFSRNGMRRLFGPHRADLLFNGANIISLTFASSPLGLALNLAEAARLLTEVRARRAAWVLYRDQVEALAPGHADDLLRLEGGERTPLTGHVVEGCGQAIGRDAMPVPVTPGSVIEAGSRLLGGPFTLRLQAGPSFDPTERPAPPRRGLDQFYAHLLGPVSLGYAVLTALFTRSLSRTFQALLLVNPRAAIIGTEGANAGAAARVLRGGVTIAGTRFGRPMRHFDLVLLDGPRLLADGLEISSVAPLREGYEAVDVLALAAGVAAAAGSPWGGVFPAANRTPASQGRFEAGSASALVAETLYSLTPLHNGHGSYPQRHGEQGILLTSERESEPLAVLWLRPRVAATTAELVACCRRYGVNLAMLPGPDLQAARAMSQRTGVALLSPLDAPRPQLESRPDALAVIRAWQHEGSLVAFVSDNATGAEAFDCCDLAVGVTGGRMRFMARADVLAPDMGALAAIVEAGALRQRAVADSVGLSALANAFGVAWAWRGEIGVARASYAVYAAALAGLLAGWVRLNGGERRRTIMSRVVDPRPEKWGARSVSQVLSLLDASPEGLTTAAAEARGRATPSHSPSRRHTSFDSFLMHLGSPLNGVLAVGGVLSFLLASPLDAAMIALTILANSTLGAWQEGQTNRAAKTLEQLGRTRVRVLRDGVATMLPSDRLVPGDVLLLIGGERVGADARLLESQALEVDEAALTGESFPMPKAVDASDDAGRMVLEGSDVTVGTGSAVVVATGGGTRMGSTAAALALDEPSRSPLDIRLNQMLRQSLPWSAGAGAIVTAAAVLRGRPLGSQLALGATVAVAAVPEGLPLLAKMGEAAVASRLSSHNALVRRLSSVEALGRVDVACTDKTGTLTNGKLALRIVSGLSEEAYFPEQTRRELSPLLCRVLLCAGLASPHPDAPDAAVHPTDVAVVAGAIAAGFQKELAATRQHDAPFDPVRAFHASRVDGRLCVKGAIEALLPRCTHWRSDRAAGAGTRTGRVRPLDEEARTAWMERATALASQGLRVLLVAEGRARDDAGHDVQDPQDLVALGFVGISDPLRANVPAAIRRCHEAGVRLIMLTGDHPATARAIARQAGLFRWQNRLPPEQQVDEASLVLTGTEIGSLDDPALDRRLELAVVVARATPLDKVRIVESLQRGGHTVAMTGDGVNDAPALRLADVGIAMGVGGTEVARQAADMVLTHDDFSTLVEALVEGRSFWRNIRRALGLLIGGNFGELALQAGISILGMAAPLTTTQILAVNMVTDVLPAVAVALQRPEDRNLSALSREGTAAFGGPLRQDVLRRGTATAVPSIMGYLLAGRAGGPQQGQTAAFISIVATQLAQTLDAGRSQGGLTRPVLGAVGGSLSLLAAALATPFLRRFLSLAVPTPLTWLLVSAAAASAVGISRLMPSPDSRSNGAAPQVGRRPLLALPAPAVPV